MAVVDDVKEIVLKLEKAAGAIAGGAVDVAKTALDEALDLAKKVAGAATED